VELETGILNRKASKQQIPLFTRSKTEQNVTFYILQIYNLHFRQFGLEFQTWWNFVLKLDNNNNPAL